MLHEPIGGAQASNTIEILPKAEGGYYHLEELLKR
jgi:hypothetical protein